MCAKADDGRGQAASPPGTNEVRLVGRVAGDPEARSLPSGDTVVLVRVIVDRPPTRASAARAPSVDTIDCALWTAALRRRSGALRPGAIVELRGSLRRRFWRGPQGAPVSRYEVEVSGFRVLRAGVVRRPGNAAADDEFG